MPFRKENNILILLLFFIGTGFSANAQIGEEKKDRKIGKQQLSADFLREIEQLVETITEETDETFDFNTLLESLIDLADKPLNLNRVTYDELLDIRFLLTPEQADAIIRHREKFGNFISIYELQAVEGLSLQTIEHILPFVKITGDLDDYQVNSIKELLFEGDFQVFARYTQVLETKEGYRPLEPGETKTKYLGNPSKIYLRFRYNFASKLSYGFTAEKDPGEQIFGSSQPRGFDFYSGHLFIRDVSIFKSIALGDYEVKLGQGLIMWSGFGFGKSTMVTNVKKESDQLRPYTSVDENRFMRGAATTVKAGEHVEITGFFSRDRKDANIALLDTFDSDFLAEVSSLQESGLHRTPSEVDDKNAITTTVVGGHIQYRKRISHIGITATHTRLSSTLNTVPRIYNQFDFSGDRITNWGFDYSWLLRNFYFFGEFAMSDSKGIATVNGFIASLDPKVDISVVHRYYQRNYHSLFSNAFGESRNAYNEHGIFFGLSIKPIQVIRLDMYLDYYKHPWLRFQTDAPSSGLDFLAQITYKPSKKIEMYVKYKNEMKEKNQPDNQTKLDYLTNIKQQNIRFHITYKVSPSFTFKNRFEMVLYNNGEKERGYMVYQDIDYSPLSFPVSFNARFAMFQTASYDSRIYAYESDVLYSFSLPPYYDKGMRFYLNIRYRIMRGIDIWVRFAQTWFADQETVGSGLEEINRSTRSEVKAQIRFKF